MSKRHQATRRRSYGRRQHEVQQRSDRRAERVRIDPDWLDAADAAEIDPLAFMDPRSLRLRFGFGH